MHAGVALRSWRTAPPRLVSLRGRVAPAAGDVGGHVAAGVRTAKLGREKRGPCSAVVRLGYLVKVSFGQAAAQHGQHRAEGGGVRRVALRSPRAEVLFACELLREV